MGPAIYCWLWKHKNWTLDFYFLLSISIGYYILFYFLFLQLDSLHYWENKCGVPKEHVVGIINVPKKDANKKRRQLLANYYSILRLLQFFSYNFILRIEWMDCLPLEVEILQQNFQLSNLSHEVANDDENNSNFCKIIRLVEILHALFNAIKAHLPHFYHLKNLFFTKTNFLGGFKLTSSVILMSFSQCCMLQKKVY